MNLPFTLSYPILHNLVKASTSLPSSQIKTNYLSGVINFPTHKAKDYPISTF